MQSQTQHPIKNPQNCPRLPFNSLSMMRPDNPEIFLKKSESEFQGIFSEEGEI
jgi:hypothetical protein